MATLFGNSDESQMSRPRRSVTIVSRDDEPQPRAPNEATMIGVGPIVPDGAVAGRAA